jgi:cytochrome c oxidase subunit 2
MIWFQRKQIRRAFQLVSALAVMMSLALISARPAYAQNGVPPSALDPKGPNGAAIATLFGVVMAIAVVVFVIVEGLLLLSAWRFRQRPDDPTEPRQIHGNTRFEIAWTIAPAIIVVVLFVLALQTQQTLDTRPPGDQLTVKVIGHQWWWEYQYPDLNITTGTDLVIPVGKVINLDISAVDVIHSFWIPQLNGKTDAFPNRVNHSWIQADAAGTFYGQCAELCGPSHANMRAVVIAKTQADFDAWVTAQQTNPAPATGDAQQGEQVFMTGICISCHTINGTAAQGSCTPADQATHRPCGPNLTHVGSRTAIAGGTLTTSEGNFKRWLKNPPGVKLGSIMPNLNLSDADIEALTAYLTSLK